MVFSSLTYLLLFMPCVVLGYRFIPAKARMPFLFAASLLFYGWGNPQWLLLLAWCMLVSWGGVLLVNRGNKKRKWILVLVIVLDLLPLFWFKYAGFFNGAFQDLTGIRTGFRSPLLPAGISFFTFQALSYVLDVWRGDAKAQRNPVTFGVYLALFPQLVAGPIVRYTDLEAQLIAGPIVQYADVAAQLDERTTSLADFNEGIERFVAGLAKKVLLANLCGAAVEALPHGGAASLGGAWYHAFLYTLQIYFDFSAYSDMAIGLGRTLGFRYKENFNYPYVSLSATEFWRRWHMSLGSFFRDYVYIPLGGNRRGAARTALNLLLVWALTGLWHGAAWNFVIWGLYFGVLLVLERFVLKRVIDKTPRAIRWALTFVIAVAGWAIFYETDLRTLADTLRALLGFSYDPALGRTALPLLDAAAGKVIRRYSVFPLIAFAFSLPVVPALKKALLARRNGEKLLSAARAVSTALLFTLSLVFLVGQSYNPFIYFRF